jgi:hypothetical protein
MKISHAHFSFILSLLSPKQKYSQHHVLKHSHYLFFVKGKAEQVLQLYMARLLLFKLYRLQIKIKITFNLTSNFRTLEVNFVLPNNHFWLTIAKDCSTLLILSL